MVTERSSFKLVKNRSAVVSREIKDEIAKLVADEAQAIKTEALSRRPDPKIDVVVRETAKGYQVRAGSRKRFWAAFMEWGTRYQAAQPFMTPAAERARSRLSSKLNAIATKISNEA